MSGKGKRGAPAPLVNSSDEEQSDHDPKDYDDVLLKGCPSSVFVAPCISTVDLLQDEDGRRQVLSPVASPTPSASPTGSNGTPSNSSQGTPNGTPSPLPGQSPTQLSGASPSPTLPPEHDYALPDHDYDNVSSPGSSTASGPVYIRQPGFAHHAHEFVAAHETVCSAHEPDLIFRSKVKKKKTQLLNRDTLYKTEPVPPKAKSKREPLPMRLRALPQSFWQQPNKPQSSPPSSFPLLPPVINKDSNNEESEMRPITPPGEKEEQKGKLIVGPPAVKPERKITIADTDLLFKLFDSVEKAKKRTTVPVKEASLRRRRPRKVIPIASSKFVSGQDPYLVECVSDKLFPQLSLEHSVRTHSIAGTNTTLQLVTMREGDKCITLPALSVEQNYSQMLSELVMHI